MTQFVEDRRLERRIPSAGEARFHVNGADYSGRLIDVSVNGIRTSRPEGFELDLGAKLKLTLHAEQVKPVLADVVMVHDDPDKIGFEFYDMTPHEFRTLSDFILSQDRELLHARFDS
jgi:c-di-GMP-binding flagellar brake protein YcgR